MERRLSAILAADAVGYSRLMQQDEAATFERLRAHRNELFEPEIAKYHGRIFKLMGDGLLAEFASVVDAVECAITLQRGMAERNKGIAADRRIDVRIGINLGDVIVDSDDICGNGVNIASRLEQLSEPGGVLVSGTAYDHLQGKLDVPLEFAGEQHVKNIARPVRVYRAQLDGAARRQRGSVGVPRGRSIAAIVLVMVLLIVGGSAAWYFYAPAQAPTNRLSVVVLPFTNLGNDPAQEYFADGITSDLTTDLSRIDNSFVIAPSTALTYKGKAIDGKQVGRELGVRYILEGSLRRTGNQIRVNAQLIDAATGAAVWADRFEGDWTKSMQLQDDITSRLARSLDLELTAAESRRAQSERPNDPDAVDLTMRAKSIMNQSLSRERLAQAEDLFEQALRIEPELPAALVGLSRTIAAEVNSRWSTAPADTLLDQLGRGLPRGTLALELANVRAAQLARADEAVARVLSAFPNNAMAHLAKGDILRARKEFEAAIAEYEVAISINPSLAPAYSGLGNAEIRAGRAEKAFTPLETAIRLSPRDPLLNIWYFHLCHAHTHLAQDDAAIEWCGRSIAVNPYWIAYVDLASAYAWTGHDAEAHAALAELRKLMPNYTVTKWANEGWSDNPVFLAQYQRIIEGLRKAGLPEK